MYKFIKTQNIKELLSIVYETFKIIDIIKKIKNKKMDL